jgi:hypothetical protein
VILNRLSIKFINVRQNQLEEMCWNFNREDHDTAVVVVVGFDLIGPFTACESQVGTLRQPMWI